jgi:hypothetical protein
LKPKFWSALARQRFPSAERELRRKAEPSELHLNGSAAGESGVKPPQSKILLFA